MEVLQAELQLRIDGFTASLQQAAQQVATFAQAITGAIGTSTQAFQQQVQQLNSVVAATKQASTIVRQTKKDESTDVIAQERATGAAIMAQIRERETAEKTTAAAITDVHKNFLATTIGMAKERHTAEKATIEAVTALQRNFFTIAVGLAKERVAEEKRAAAQVLATWQAADRALAQQESQQALRIEQRFRARNAAGNAQATSALNPLGQGPGGVLVAQDLFLLQGYANLIKEAAKESTFFDASIGRIGTSVRTMGGYFAATAILSIPAAIAAWGREAVQTAVKMESLRASFNAIAGSAAAGAKDLDFVRQVANRIGVDFLKTADSFKSLEAAARGTKLEGEKVKILFEQLSGGFRVLGLSSDQASHALLAVEQMISKGTISAEELRRQLGNAMPGAVSIMARAVGVGTEELMKMMKAGELLAVDVLPKFGNQVQKEFGPGLAQASRTAMATFAKLGNEIREISVLIGTTLLKALQPAADFITTLLAKAREARELQEKTAAKVGAEVRAGKPIVGFTGTTMELAAGFTEQEAQQAERMVEHIIDLRKRLTSAQYLGRPQDVLRRQAQEEEESFRQLNAVIEERTRLSKQEEASDDTARRVSTGQAQADANAKYAKSVKEVVDLQKQLPTELQKITSLSAILPTIYGKAEERLRVIKKLMEDYRDLLDKSPNLRLDPSVQKALGAGEAAAKSVQAEIDAREAGEATAKKAAQEHTRLENEKVRLTNQLAEERIRIEEQMSLVITEATQGEAEKKIEAMQKVLFEARRTGVEETTIAQYEATTREKIRTEEVRNFLEVDQAKLTSVKRRSEEQMALEQLITDSEAKTTTTRLDDWLAAQDIKKRKIEEGIQTGLMQEEALDRLAVATASGAARITQEEYDKAAKEAEKSWIELGNTIEGTLAGMFNSILQGSKSLFEGIRSAFLSLLAKLAADALTNAIIIPAIVQFVGGGSTGGASGLASAGSLFSGGGLTGAGMGGSEGSGSSGPLGQAMGLVSAGNSISGALGGPSIGLGTGGFGAGIAATEIGRLPLIGSYLGGPGAGVAGPTTALGAATVGQVVGGIGAGIAVGMILSQINKLIGFGGTGSAVAAGAGGGAAAGAILGTVVFPGIGTGIGAAIGTAVGALGGYLSTLFGKEKKQPGFDIQDIQPGQVEYDTSVGLRIRQNFKILDDFHQKLGTDYEDFIAVMDDSINDMFEQVVSQASGASPEVQRALVEPLNAALGSIAAQIAAYPAIGGEDFKKQLEVMMQDFADIFEGATQGAVTELMEAVAKIDPVVKAFVRIIDSLLEDIRELERQQKTLNAALEGNIQTLRESLMSPAEIFATRKQEYASLLTQFEGGDEATKIALAPQIGNLSTVILDLSKQLFSSQNSYGDVTGIQSAIRTIQESLFTPAQTIAARQGDLAMLMDQFRSGNQVIKATLTPQITQLALQIMELAKGVTTLAEQQALMADFPAQLRAITEALFSPAQSYLSQQQQLSEMLTRFRSATPEQQIALEPQIAQLAAQIISLARSPEVLGQDPQLLRQTQSDLLTVVQEVQNTISGQVLQQSGSQAALQATLERTQGELLTLLREVEHNTIGSIVNAGVQTVQAIWTTAGQIISTDYAMTNGIITAQYYTTNGVVTAQYTAAGQLMNTEHYIGGVLQGSIDHTSNTVAAWSNALYQVQAQLIGQVASVRDTAWYSYTQLAQALWTEIGLAQHEIQLLVASLYHLETVDAVVQRALGVLGEMNARLGNPLNVTMNESLGTQLQRDAINVAQQSLHIQRQGMQATIALLAKPAFGLDFGQGMQLGRDVLGFQHGGLVPRNMTTFLHAGERVIPEWENRGSGGGRGAAITINVYGAGQDANQIANMVIDKIEQKSGRLHTSTIQTSRR